MKKLLFVLMILVIFALACGGSSGGGDAIPTLVQPAQDVDATPTSDETPRIGPDSGLPPTWTPVPTSAPPTPQATGEEGVPSGTQGQETYTV